ncbi:hypothetical protein Clacol_007468 [Clathrus columnatus]|uniref:Histone H4 n=1 Tax=Clathrus columnatus TaxID=1419009 RepID=A0AAV5AF10_9AGAM|nr:hypothetical protein Clacol_007468 [Clathrus columnatus]
MHVTVPLPSASYRFTVVENTSNHRHFYLSSFATFTMSGRGKGGKGLGKGGAKRHRKILRDNIQGITKPAIRRLARRGGVKRISGLIYEETRGVLKIFLEAIIRDSVTYTEHAKRKTVTALDVVYALKRSGRTLYGFGLSIHALTTPKPSFIKSKTFVVPHQDGIDDAIAVRNGLANFNSDSVILFEKGTTYNILTPLNFGTLTNVDIVIEGNITLPSNITQVQGGFVISGTNVTLQGTEDPEWGWVDGHGQAWWDAVQQANRPHGWKFTSKGGGVVKDIKIYKPIAWNWSFEGKDITVSNIIILAESSTSVGFSATGTNILIENSHVVNGDDCLTVGSGGNNITFRNNYCQGGHGLSIGSLGENGAVASVSNVFEIAEQPLRISDNKMVFEQLSSEEQDVNSLYGARFKSWLNGKGAAVNYVDQEVSAPTTPTANSTSTHIENFLFENFSGTLEDVPFVEGSCISDPCWYAVPGATGKEVVIFDLFPDTATNVLAKNLLGVRTETGAPLRVLCDPSEHQYSTMISRTTPATEVPLIEPTETRPNPAQIKIICLGLGRTGTASLKEALTMLGFGPAYHMFEVLNNDGRDFPAWSRIGDGGSTAADLDDILRGYTSVLDTPPIMYPEELYAAYPNAKYILTLRDPVSFEKSMKSTILQLMETIETIPTSQRTHVQDSLLKWNKKYLQDVLSQSQTSEKYHQGRIYTHTQEEFHRHNERVKKLIPSEQLLVFEVSQGWGPLTEFLGV